jgi:hypothetical protein
MPAWLTITLSGSEQGILHRNHGLTMREERFIDMHGARRLEPNLSCTHSFSAASAPLSAREIAERAGSPYSFSSYSLLRDLNSLYNGPQFYDGNYVTILEPEVQL